MYHQQFASFSPGSIGDGYDIVACSDCGMCYATGLPDPQRFAEYYADSSKYDLAAQGAALSVRDIQRYSEQAAFVAAQAVDRASPALDVGTATGGFLVALREAGFERPFGVDPSPDAVRFAREAHGLEATVGGLEAAASWGETFGLVSFVAVLEHVLHPREQVRAAAHVLREDGCIFVSVPDAGAFGDHVDAPFQEFSVEHINFFTASSLSNAMAAEGFSLVGDRRAVLPLGSNGRGPALEAVYRRERITHPIVRDRAGIDDMREYVRRSATREAPVLERVARLASSGERIYVWGTGTHTLHLLQVSRLGDCRIEAFLDSNPHYAASTLAGRPVLMPSELNSVDAPILVSSAVSQSGIAAAAREQFGRGVQLILLY